MRSRHGFSLLEVILALAILGLSLSVIGQLIGIGSARSRNARDLTTAQMLCESKMTEIVTGIIPPDAVTDARFDVDENWRYTIEQQPVDQEGLLAVRVTVVQRHEGVRLPATISLIRWLRDPATTGEAETEVTP